MFSSNTSAANGAANYIEDVFSTWLYQGTSANQTITNGIDLSTKGGLVWCKGRPNAGYSHRLFDTARGVNNSLATDLTDAQFTQTNSVTAFNTTGFSLGSDGNGEVNFSGSTYASWTFRKQPKFFDIVTYTGTGVARTIAHNLGSAPGFYVVKRTDSTSNWSCYHRSLGNGGLIDLNSTSDASLGNGRWNFTSPTSTVFSVNDDASVNASGGTYVAYLFAHDAGGFGLTGTDNVITCGTYTGAGGNTSVNLGYEPQLVITKGASIASNWTMFDNMRGVITNGVDAYLKANLTDAETSSTDYIDFNSTGFTLTANSNLTNGSGYTYVYIAIRRGPMKVPTTGTSVFGMSARSGTGANATVTGGQTDDAVLVKNRGSAVASLLSSRLTGTGYMVTSTSAIEVAAGTTILQANPWDVMDGVKVGTTSTITNASSNTYINYLFKRAPSFMDVVCFSGNSSNPRTINHNLQAVPEMMVVKARSGGADTWITYTSGTGNTKYLEFQNTLGAQTSSSAWNDTSPTSSVFTVAAYTNESGKNYIAYLFSTCAGVSKVGSYTGNGSTQTINCGLTAGARFVLIKRTDTSGDWYVYDTARGMTVLTDPYWLLNSANAESATLGSVTTVATGFALNSTILSAINVNAGTYIFLAIA